MHTDTLPKVTSSTYVITWKKKSKYIHLFYFPKVVVVVVVVVVLVVVVIVVVVVYEIIIYKDATVYSLFVSG